MANSAIMIAVPGLIDAPVQLQGYAMDEVLDTEEVTTAEIQMGVDGNLSAGWVPTATVQRYVLQGDSASVSLFETWDQAQKAQRDLFFADGVLSLPSLGTVYSMTKGVLTGLMRAPSAGKIIKPRRFTLTWQSVDPAGL